MTEPPPMLELVSAVLAEAGRTSMIHELPRDLGSPHRTHVYVFDDVVVKLEVSRTQRGVRERLNLAALAETDLPVPRVVGAGELADGRQWLVLTRLEGSPPGDAWRPVHDLSVGLAAQLGGLAARLHTVPVPSGYGPPNQPVPNAAALCEARTENLVRQGDRLRVVGGRGVRRGLRADGPRLERPWLPRLLSRLRRRWSRPRHARA